MLSLSNGNRRDGLALKKCTIQVNFGLYKKYIKKKNIDDARVTQDKVIVKHGLKKMAAF